jgi:Zn-dependent protease
MTESKTGKSMKWSWKMGRFAGIDVYVHATFLLLIGWVMLSHWLEHRTVAASAAGVLFTLAVFLCVLLHEYGHALSARRFGVATHDITLLPIGGVARLERMPTNPRHELWIALAGPAVNLAIAGGLFAWLHVVNRWEPISNLSLTGGSFVERLLVANVFLAAFNLLPAFPMDGGRMMRAILAMRMEHLRATRIAAGLGQGMAFLFGFAGLMGNPFLLFIALFVWIGATQEAAAAQTGAWLEGVPLRRVMMTDFHSLSAGDTLGRAVELTLTGHQQDFPILEGSQVAGILTRDNLLIALATHGTDLPVAGCMSREFRTAGPSDSIEELMGPEAAAGSLVLVLENGRLLGVVNMENVGEFVAFRSAIEKSPVRRRMEFVRA